MTDTPLTMLQFQPDVFRASAWMTAHGVTRAGHDDGYGWHALLRAAFGDLAPKPFRVVEPKPLRPDQKPKPLHVLAYTSSSIDALREHAARFADPAVVSALNLETGMSHKRMPGQFANGQRFGFEVLVRPTVRQDRGGDRNSTREKDAFLAAIDKLPPRGGRDDIRRDDVYRQWLADRMTPAAILEQSELTQLNRAILLRRGVKISDETKPGDQPKRVLHAVGAREKRKAGDGTNAREGGGGPEAVFTGTLTVGDATAFHALLARGVGRHRSFGFGMLLLRPVR